jgi:hypothetical protein
MEKIDLVIADSADVTQIFSVIGYKRGAIFMPAGWTAAALRIMAAPTGGATPIPLTNDGTEIDMAVVVDKAFVLPDAVFSSFFIQLWSHNAGVSAPQAAERTITLTLQS